MIGDTASISLLTGLPGSGKSLRFAEAMYKLVERGDHVYYANVEGLKIKGTTPWPDPKDWRDLPAGSVLFVDEAQEFFPARRSGNPPPEVIMNRIRHDGIRIVLATQQPDYLDSYLRGLVGRHEHLLRREGKQESFMFADNHVMENVRQKVKVIKRTYDYTTYKFDPFYFTLYDSAQTHTIKWVMPQLMKRALVLGPLALLLVGGAWSYVFGDAWSMRKKAKEQTEAAQTAAGRPSSGGAGTATTTPAQAARVPRTKDGLAVAQVPRISHQPWTAPIFDSVYAQPRSKPEAYCISSKPGLDADGKASGGGCTCITEQGTSYELDQQTCFSVVKQGGSYNPFREPQSERSQEVSKQAADAPPEPVAARAALPQQAQPYGTQATYGEFALDK